jgi:DNA-directed RNA polymerase alpha subunit
MSVIKIPDWLGSRPIDSNDTGELISLTDGKNGFYFRDITIEILERFYKQQQRTSFYKLIRILGFYGVNFSGKLAKYSGPKENYPDVLSVKFSLWRDKIVHLSNTNLASPFLSCGIILMKQLHGVPVKCFLELAGISFSSEQITSLLPVTTTQAHDGLFYPNQFLSKKYMSTNERGSQYQLTASQQPKPNTPTDFSDPRLSSSINTLGLSVRSLNCLRAGNINYIGELVGRRDDELLAIPHLGWKSCHEIKARLLKIGLRAGMQVEKRIEPQNDTDLYSASIGTLELSVRSKNCLRMANIHSISELLSKRDEDLLAIPHFGTKCLREIRAKLSHVQPGQIESQSARFIIKREEANEIDIGSEEVIRDLNTKVSDLVLSVRSRRCLKEKKVQYIWQLVQLTEKELLEFRNLGRKSINELKEKVQNPGFKFGIQFSPKQINEIRVFEYSHESISLDETIKGLIKKLSRFPLDCLSIKEHMVITERILNVSRKKTLESLAQDLSLSRERVRQIEQSAINKIKHQYKKELRIIVSTLKKQVLQLGGLANFDEIDIDLVTLTTQEQALANFMIKLIDRKLFLDWDYGLISTKGEDWILSIFDEIQDNLLHGVSNKIFTQQDLEAAAKKAVRFLDRKIQQVRPNSLFDPADRFDQIVPTTHKAPLGFLRLAGNGNAFEHTMGRIFSQPNTIQPVRLHKLPGRSEYEISSAD